MPQVLTVPSWYNDDTYIKNKVVECNTIKFGDQSDWSADTVKAFLAGAYGEDTYASWIGYDNFVNSGNAENCSPSPYFVVAEYLAAKAAQLNGIKYNDKTDWNQQDVLKAFNDAGITAWDHYTTSGQAENINPSNAFDTSAFFAAKCDILNNWTNEDGTTGFEGKNDWTPEDVIATFQGLGINPIMNQPDNPNASSLIIQVPSDEQVQGNNFNVWNPTGEIDYVDVPVTTDPLANVGTAANENFIADVTTSSRTSTLLRDTTIDGDGGQDMLTVNMSGNFRGFANENALTNVETVTLNNTTKTTHSFNAQNTNGVETWVLNEGTGVLNLTNLPSVGVTVNVNDLAGGKTTNIGFGRDVAAAQNDSMTLGLKDVGTDKVGDTPIKYAQVNMEGIEDLTINSTGTNFVNLVGVDSAKNIDVAGAGNIRIDANGSAPAVAKTVQTFDASAATGNVIANLGNADMIDSVEMGAGNDKVTVANIQETALVDGSGGEDELVLNSNVGGNYRLQMNDVETLTLANTKAIVLSGSDTSGLETLKLDAQTNNVTLGDFDNSALTLQAINANTATVQIGDIEDITLNIGDDDNKLDSFSGNLLLADATNLSINVEGPSSKASASFTGMVDAENVTDLSINNGHNAAIFTLGASSDLGNVSQLNVTGFNNVDLTGAANIGEKSDSLNVDASTLNAEFKADFTSAVQGASITIEGSSLQANTISVNQATVDGKSNYSSIDVTGGLADDVLVLSGDGTGIDVTGDLGMGVNKIILAEGATNWVLYDPNTNIGNVNVENAELASLASGFTGTWEAFQQAEKTYSGDVDIKINAADDTDDTIDVNDFSYYNPTSVTIQLTVGADDTITLGAANGTVSNDTVVIGSGFASSAPESLNITISNFGVNGTDKISFAGDLAAFNGGFADAPATAGTYDPFAPGSPATNGTIKANALSANKIYDLDAFASADSPDDIIGLFVSYASTSITSADDTASDLSGASDKFYLASGAQAMIITGEEGSQQLWYISNTKATADGGTAGIDEGEVFLIGTINGAALATDSFATGA